MKLPDDPLGFSQQMRDWAKQNQVTPAHWDQMRYEAERVEFDRLTRAEGELSALQRLPAHLQIEVLEYFYSHPSP